MNKFGGVRYFKTVVNAEELESSAAEVAFVGRSNVGKSSILNVVCKNKNLARISKTPGRTRAINVFSAVEGKWIVDLPGYGFARGSKEEVGSWQAMIEGYLLSRQSLRMVFMIVDGNVGVTKLDGQMARWFQNNGIPFCIVANKCDKVSFPKQEESRKNVANSIGLNPEEIHWVSTKKGTGIDDLTKDVANILEL